MYQEGPATLTQEELKLSPIELSKRIRKDQGNHEADVSCGDEADLGLIFVMCTKNPLHEGFISVNKFCASRLPPCYRTQDFVNCVKAVSEFSVRILSRHTSPGRPRLYPETDSPYPFYNYRGSGYLRVGSGWLDGVGMKFTPENNRRCPCQACKASTDPSFTWGQFWVHTALHVVYDRDEALKTQCELFYNDDESRHCVSVLDGVDTVGSCLEDTCSVRCVTHDTGLVDRMNEMWSNLHELQEKARASLLTDAADLDRLAIIVSHPHGRSKHISVGEWTHRQSHGDDWTQYYYTTKTCPGSSGAPVYLLGKERGLALSTNHPHSAKCEEPGLNTSGIWWE